MQKPVYRPKLDLSDWKKADSKELEHTIAITSPELHSFILDHQSLSSAMDEVRQGYSRPVYEKALFAIRDELEHHFHFEEVFILPRLANHIRSDQVGPAVKILGEHATITRNYTEAHQMFASCDLNHPNEELVQRMNLLAYLLKKHIEKENHYFFPMLSLILTPKEKKAIERDVSTAERTRSI